MKICAYCHTPARFENQRFCSVCGKSFDSEKESHENNTASPEPPAEEPVPATPVRRQQHPTPVEMPKLSLDLEPTKETNTPTQSVCEEGQSPEVVRQPTRNMPAYTPPSKEKEGPTPVTAPKPETGEKNPPTETASKPSKAETPRPVRPHNWWVILVIVLVVLLLGGFAFVFLNSKPSEQNPSAPSVADVSAASAAQAESSISSSETALPESRPDASSAASTTVSATSEAESSAPEVVLDSTQNIRVEASGNTAVLTLQHYQDGQWIQDFQTAAFIGSNGITEHKTEGDHKTPAGTFPICFAFSNTTQNTKLPFIKINEDSVWVCDSSSAFYNTLQSRSNVSRDWADKGGCENMYVKFSKKSSTACICFGFNGDGQTAHSASANGGSVLFLDGVGPNGKMDSGYGDIKISSDAMSTILGLLDPTMNPKITIVAA